MNPLRVNSVGRRASFSFSKAEQYIHIWKEMDVSVANRNVSMPIVSPVKTGSFAHFSNSTREKAQTTYRIPSKSYKTNH